MAVRLVPGSSHYATWTAHHASLSGATLRIRVKLNAISGNNILLNIAGPATNTARMTFRVSSTDSKLIGSCRRINGDAVTNVNGGTALSTGTVYTITLVANYTGSRMDIYINGVSDGSTTGISGWGTASDSNASAGAAIGGRADGGAGNFLDADVQDCAFWQRALSAAEVLDDYNGNTPSGGAAHNRWVLGTTSGTAGTITDHEGNDNATAQNSPSYVSNFFATTGAFAATGVAGDMALDVDDGQTGVFACDGVAGTMALDADPIRLATFAATGVVGNMAPVSEHDGGAGSSTLKGALGVTTSWPEHYQGDLHAGAVFENLGENNYQTWQLLPDGSPSPPAVPTGTLPSVDPDRNVSKLIELGVRRAFINVNSDVFRLVTVHDIDTQSALEDFLTTYVVPNYERIFWTLENAGIKTVVFNVQPRDTAGGTALTRHGELFLNVALASCSIPPSRIVDVYSYLVDVDGTLKNNLTTDTTHPNDNATPTMAAMARAAMGDEYGFEPGLDADLATTGVVGGMSLDADPIQVASFACSGVAGTMALSASPGGVIDAAFACSGVVGGMALNADPIQLATFAPGGTVGTMALDADPIRVAAFACSGVVGGMALDVDTGIEVDFNTSGVAGVMAFSGGDPNAIDGSFACVGVTGTMAMVAKNPRGRWHDLEPWIRGMGAGSSVRRRK